MSETILGGFMTVGETYILINKADPGRALNVWSNSIYPAANLSNVCLWTMNTGDTAQHWKLVKSGGHYLLKPVDNENVALDLYTGSGSGANFNAHLYTPSQTSWLTFELAADDRHIKIKLENYNKYLTANPNVDGSRIGVTSDAAGNVYFWQGGLTDGSQEWTPRRVGGGSTGSGQKLIYPMSHNYHTAGYKNDSPAYPLVFPFGSHYAIDLVPGSSNSERIKVRASGNGRIVGYASFNSLGNVIAIQYDNVTNRNGTNIGSVIFLYCHLDNIQKYTGNVLKGEWFADRGETGSGANSPHLHMEISVNTASPLSTPSENGGADMTLNPLDILYKSSSQVVSPDSAIGGSEVEVIDGVSYAWYNTSRIQSTPIA